MIERLQKYIAECQVASRRKAEDLIKNGFIKVNNTIVQDMGIKIDTDKDKVFYKNKEISKAKEKIYVILNKPEGYITTTKEQFNRPMVLDLLNNLNQKVNPVGRLDYNSSGLLILTNDGDLIYKLTHPSHEINKTYITKIIGVPSENELNNLRNGIEIDGYKTSNAQVDVLKIIDNKYTELKITIHEGKNRQIRKMCSAIGHEVISLKRISIGNIKLQDLKEGQWRFLNKNEIQYLKALK